jgi:hypothetical protein
VNVQKEILVNEVMVMIAERQCVKLSVNGCNVYKRCVSDPNEIHEVVMIVEKTCVKLGKNV